jgi:hypothetical protein
MGSEEQRAMKERLRVLQEELVKRETEIVNLTAVAAEAAACVRSNRTMRDELDLLREQLDMAKEQLSTVTQNISTHEFFYLNLCFRRRKKGLQTRRRCRCCENNSKPRKQKQRGERAGLGLFC